ncbi:hypothetical protein E0L93_13665 [Rubrobacter taiwanensis]|uniref:Uncharacterized protein n=1 Tax=Rubrobacter taiwanensis TaxID=185139 RepID=A0A4R1BDB2_9ACTN|nr:hypothetical protein [Rubrobacter taiwanensis]TCJ15007.1 hypothetical protein E0L93_13665 [Rubrobacter taiwanensis]
MENETRFLTFLTAGCTLAAALFGFGASMFSFQGAYEDNPVFVGAVQLMRVLALLVLALVLVFRGGWRGVIAAGCMVVGATFLEWLFYPFSFTLASVSDPAGYAARFGEVTRPGYAEWAVFDIFFITIAAALAQSLRVIAFIRPRDE